MNYINRPEHIACAREMALASGEIIRRSFNTALEVMRKRDQSLVTRADQEAERVMREIVASRFPDHGFIGEELGQTQEEAQFVWVGDPIDCHPNYLSVNL